MKRDCDRMRERLTAQPHAAFDSLTRQHLSACVDCARFVARLGAARELLAERASVEPDPTFAARVVARLPQPVELIGLAALRMLPATLAVVVVLAFVCLRMAPGPADELVTSEPTTELLSWLAPPTDGLP